MTELIMTFLRTGKLGFLSLGMSIAQAQEELEDLEDKLLRATKKRKIYDYGDLTLHFVKTQLDIISLSCKRGHIALPVQIAKEGVIELNPMKYDEFIRLLSEEKIDFSPYQWTEDLFGLKLESGVHIYFDRGELYSIVRMSD